MCGIQKPAAEASSSAEGTGNVVAALARHSSANDPWPSMNPLVDITRVPTGTSAPSPLAVTTPASSWPGVNGSGGVRR